MVSNQLFWHRALEALLKRVGVRLFGENAK